LGNLVDESQFDFFNGLMFAGCMMHQAESLKCTPLEYYGSRKNHEAIDVAVNCHLVANILHQKWIPSAITSVDAELCYDQIPHAAGYLCAQIWDGDPNAILAMLRRIQRMKYFLCTAFGDSKTFFSSLDNILAFQGSCQGTKGSPAFWLAVSAFLVFMLHQLGHVAWIISAMSQSLFEAVGFFVDDTNLITVATSKSETPAQVMAWMQLAVNSWHSGLRASGGALKPEKCSWCLVSFYWEQGPWFYATPALLPSSLTILVPASEPIIVTRHDPSEAIKVVGVMQALDGNMSAQLQTLQTKAEQWSQQIRDGWVPRNLARWALEAMLWPSLCNPPLRTSNLTERQGEQITSGFNHNLLPSLGTSGNYSLVFCHAPASLNGLALPHPYVEQGISHICLDLTHGAIDTPTGALLRASLEQAQLEVGIGIAFLSTPFEQYGFLLTYCLWSGL
jgi:hypothetical protein